VDVRNVRLPFNFVLDGHGGPATHANWKDPRGGAPRPERHGHEPAPHRLRGVRPALRAEKDRERFARLKAMNLKTGRAWAIKDVAKMIKRHLSNVMSYFNNSKIQTIKKRAYGFRNRENFKTAIYFHCGGWTSTRRRSPMRKPDEPTLPVLKEPEMHSLWLEMSR
jgi:hypothetical protein